MHRCQCAMGNTPAFGRTDQLVGILAPDGKDIAGIVTEARVHGRQIAGRRSPVAAHLNRNIAQQMLSRRALS